jgi:hypothetical protein
MAAALGGHAFDPGIRIASVEALLIATADADQFTAGLRAAWLVTAAALLLAALAGRRLPASLGDALLFGSLSGLVLLAHPTLTGRPADGLALSADLIGLAFLWLLAALWADQGLRFSPAGETPALPQSQAARRELAVHAAALAGLLVLPATMLGGQPVAAGVLMLRLGLLLCLAAGLYAWRRGALARYGALAILLTFIVLFLVGPFGPRSRQPTATIIFLATAATLLVVLIANLADWRQRVRLWRTEPQRLIDPPPHRRLYSLVITACVLVGIIALRLMEAAVTPLATGSAAFAVLVVGHRWRSNAIGELGLMLVAETIIIAPTAWLPRSSASGLLGWALAGVYLLWLARFWEQQLCQGRPWTTAGRLIPIARQLSLAAVGGQVLTVGFDALGPGPQGPVGWRPALAALLMLLHWWMLVRDARERQSGTTALAACLVLLAATVPIHRIAADQGHALPPGALLAAAGLVLALRVGRVRSTAAEQWAWNAYIGGFVPLAVAYDLAWRGSQTVQPAAAGLAAGCALLAIGWRWGVSLRIGRVPDPPAPSA